MAKKSTLIAYLLFFIGGIWAWHLLYLKRSRQAVLYCCTFGGFGMGLLYDLFHIPGYVSQANIDEDYVELHMYQRRHEGRPEIAWERCLAEFVFGLMLGCGIISAFPDSWMQQYRVIYYVVLCILGPAFVSYGVWFVGGIGSQRSNFGCALIGAFITIPLLIRSGPPDLYITAASCTIWSNFRGNRIRTLEEINLEQKQSYFIHLFQFSVFLFFAYGLLFSMLYHNTSITLQDGVEVPVHEAVHNFINSQAYKDLKVVLLDVVKTLWYSGPAQAWHSFIRISDPQGEGAAFQALQLEPGASEAEIDKQCRKLLRDHHPDRFQNEERKMQEQDIFLKVQAACERLSAIRQRRIQRNRQSVKEDL